MSSEKTEQPTPKKERDARSKGQVARSQEVVTTVSLFGVLIVIYVMGGSIWAQLVSLMDTVAGLAANKDESSLSAGLMSAWSISVSIMMPILAATLVFGIAANAIQVGALFSFEAITPKLEKISIAKGFKRIFSVKQLIEMLKSIFKIIFLTFLLYFVVRNAIGPYITSVGCGVLCLSTVTSAVLLQLLLYSALAFVIVAGLDFMYQKHSHTKSLMMTKDEVKREYKESEGDPIVKGQRRALAQELVMSDNVKQVQSSSAVVVNPTHLAIAIRYDPDTAPLPVVVAKGRMLQAMEIRIAAEQAGVPIFRNVPLARQLFADTAPGDYVPDDLFDIVAEILAWVQRHEEHLHHGPLGHGDLDMERGDHLTRDRPPA